MKKEDLKVLIFAALLVLFESAIYLLSKLSPIETTVLTSTFDDKLPFIAAFSLVYCLWYVYLILVPFILSRVDKKMLYKYASITIISIICGALVFIFFPTTIVRDVDLSNSNIIFKLILKVIYFMDTPILCCLPSMHCALSYIFIYTILKAKNFKWYYKLIIVITSLGIVASTLFIKQHVIWDVLAAIALFIIALIIDKFVPLDKWIEEKYEKINFKK